MSERFAFPRYILLVKIPNLLDQWVEHAGVESLPEFEGDRWKASQVLPVFDKFWTSSRWPWTPARILAIIAMVKECPPDTQKNLLDHLAGMISVLFDPDFNSDATLDLTTGDVSCDWAYVERFLSDFKTKR